MVDRFCPLAPFMVSVVQMLSQQSCFSSFFVSQIFQPTFTPMLFIEVSFFEWWDAVLQKRLAWALFGLLLSALVCCQPTWFWVFFYFINFTILLPPPPPKVTTLWVENTPSVLRLPNQRTPRSSCAILRRRRDWVPAPCYRLVGEWRRFLLGVGIS